MQHQGVLFVQLRVRVPCGLCLSAMQKNSFAHSGGPAVMKEGRVLAKTPEWLGSEFVSKGIFHGDSISKLRAHVVQQEVRIGVDQAQGCIQARGMTA